METTARHVGLDIHKQHILVAAVDGQQQVALKPRKISVQAFSNWAIKHLRPTDRVAMESTSNAWHWYDHLIPLVAEVRVANAYKVKLISQSRVKTDKQDALVLAQLLAANLLPSVWVPPPHVRELRGIVAHRFHLVRDRTAAKNRLHSVLHRHNLSLPAGDPFSQENREWWQAQALSPTEILRIRHELRHIEHLTQLITEVEAEVARLSVTFPWDEQVAFLVQLPGVGLNSAMTILSAIGDIGRFPSAKQLVGYAGLGASVHASGQTYRTGKITKQGRRELRVVLVECTWMAVRHSPVWKSRFNVLTARSGKQKAIVAIARKLLVVVWHVLTQQVADRDADAQAVARSLMTWATGYRLARSLGMTRPVFVKRELERLGLASEVDRMRYGSKTYHVANLRTYTVKQGTPVSAT